MKYQIESVSINLVPDESPDLSYYGEFTDESSPEAFIRFGEHTGKQVKELPEDADLSDNYRRFQFCYFLPAMTGEESGNPESPKQDWKRMEACGQSWIMLGIFAKARLLSPTGATITIRSAGVGGVESDGDTSDIEKEELASLRSELAGMGISERALQSAFKNVSRK